MKKNVFMLIAIGIIAIGMVSGCKSNDQWVDLGLPSGTQWKDANADGFYTYAEAVKQFGDELPSKKQCLELVEECEWTWGKLESSGEAGYRVTGPNGNSIFLPAAGVRDGDDVEDVDTWGNYWSSTDYDKECVWGLCFDNVYPDVTFYGRDIDRSVRLVRNSK